MKSKQSTVVNKYCATCIMYITKHYGKHNCISQYFNKHVNLLFLSQ